MPCVLSHMANVISSSYWFGFHPWGLEQIQCVLQWRTPPLPPFFFSCCRRQKYLDLLYSSTLIQTCPVHDAAWQNWTPGHPFHLHTFNISPPQRDNVLYHSWFHCISAMKSCAVCHHAAGIWLWEHSLDSYVRPSVRRGRNLLKPYALCTSTQCCFQMFDYFDAL